jgi:uncharacterized membrane protein YfcA
MSLTDILIPSLIIFSASLVSSLCGFGFALVAVPFMLMIYQPTTVIPMITILGLMLDISIIVEARKWVDWNQIKFLMGSGIIGMFLGVLALKYFDMSSIKIYIGVLITLFSAASLTGFQRKIENEKLGYTIVGLLCGFLGGSTSIAGPPVVLFLNNQGTSKLEFRANMIAFLLVIYCVTIPVYVLSSLLSLSTVISSVYLLPAVFAGAYLGTKLSYRVDEALFRKIVLFIVSIAGITSIITSI